MEHLPADAEKKYREDFRLFAESAQKTTKRFELNIKDAWPCLNDATESTSFDRHYVYHTAWAARCLAASKPRQHIDLSSSLYFCSIVSAFLPVKFYDIRPPNLKLSQLEVDKADLAGLPFESASVASLSCMHVVEHIGLGRYGDSIDYDGDLKAIAELCRVVRSGGQLLFVVPVGQAKIQFNAHRIYAYSEVIKLFPEFSLKEFALIPDQPAEGGLVSGAPKELADQQSYGCGCFWFIKK